MEAVDKFIACGFTKPIATMTIHDVELLVECVTLHSTILVVKAELDQVIEGLAESGVLEMLRSHPHLFKGLFVDKHQPLSASKCSSIRQ